MSPGMREVIDRVGNWCSVGDVGGDVVGTIGFRRSHTVEVG